jgi:hypothetical protein
LVAFLFGALAMTFAGHGSFVDENLIIQVVESFAEDGTLPVRSRLKEIGLPARPNAKINMGLGRPIIEE